MSANKTTKHQKPNKSLSLIGIVVYILTIAISSILFLANPGNLNAKVMLALVVILLFLSALCFSGNVASKNSKRSVAVTGTIALSILFTFVGFFIVASVGWFVAVSQV